jgi:Spermine/spermidine synthase domain
MQPIRLFLFGFLTLFLELVLIRYLAGNIWNLGYFPNLVLLSVFVGMGTGFVSHHRFSETSSRRLLLGSAVLLLGLTALVHFERPAVPGFSRAFAEFDGELFYTATPAKSDQFSLIVFALWFLLVVSIFFLISQRTAKFFRLFNPLKAYTLDISGSICGILFFMLMSWLQVPAFLWFLIVMGLYLLVLEQWNYRLAVVPLILIVSFIARYEDTRLLSAPKYTGKMEVHWSPYQKVEYSADSKSGTKDQIFVNGVYHQNMNTGPEIRRGFYSRPYEDRAKRADLPPYESVLVIGAGSGNDVTAALMHGAKRVDAVEIDPVIAELGRKLHPEKPYDDSRTIVTINDARAFMTRTARKYDLIVFALTDSLVKVSPMAQLRLENYIYTVDSIRRANELLTPDGDLLFYNLYRKPWLIQKIKIMIHQATGRWPRIIIERKDGFAVLLAGIHNQGEPLEATDGVVEPATDDWPFPYLKEKGIPRPYIAAMAGLTSIAALMLFFVHRSAQGERLSAGIGVKLAFLFMGIAFLLLETKSVIQFSLLFGTTWINSSLVFLGVLSLILAANWAASLIKNAPRALWISYLLLIGFCLLTPFYPLANLLYVESRILRFITASILTFSPIFFANVIFSITFRDQEIAEHLFGWNLIGATLGGVLEYSSLALGYERLAIIVAICYTIVFLLLVRRAPAHVRAVA